MPAVGQGCVAVEARADDERDDRPARGHRRPATRRGRDVERAFLAELGAGCSLPVGAHVADGRLRTFLASTDQHGRHVDLIVASDEIELVGDDGDLERAPRSGPGRQGGRRLAERGMTDE